MRKACLFLLFVGAADLERGLRRFFYVHVFYVGRGGSYGQRWPNRKCEYIFPFLTIVDTERR